jgi:hypothetical protein
MIADPVWWNRRCSLINLSLVFQCSLSLKNEIIVSIVTSCKSRMLLRTQSTIAFCEHLHRRMMTDMLNERKR